MQERLQKVIARAGMASRRQAEEWIEEGRVIVNGACITELGTKVDPQKDHIHVDGKRIRPEERKIYLLLNKPQRYITTVDDPEGRPTVMQILPKCKERIYPVGRLDFHTEGLLLFTNDGELAHKLIHPRFGIKKRYWAKVEGYPTEAQIAKLERGGVSMPVGKSAPCEIMRLPPRYATDAQKGSKQPADNSWWEVVLREGKNQEVRHLMAKIGHPVLKLKRIGFANLTLGTLPIGGSRLLTPGEIAGLQKQVMHASEGSEDKAIAFEGRADRRAPFKASEHRPYGTPRVPYRDTAASPRGGFRQEGTGDRTSRGPRQNTPTRARSGFGPETRNSPSRRTNRNAAAYPRDDFRQEGTRDRTSRGPRRNTPAPRPFTRGRNRH